MEKDQNSTNSNHFTPSSNSSAALNGENNKLSLPFDLNVPTDCGLDLNKVPDDDGEEAYEEMTFQARGKNDVKDLPSQLLLKLLEHQTSQYKLKFQASFKQVTSKLRREPNFQIEILFERISN